jgi:heterodisulfide reductase subunit B
MSYLFYPGCSLESTARDYRDSVLAVCRALGIELPELPDWTCCGSTAAHQSDPRLAVALPAKNLAAAAGSTVVVCCAACHNRLKTANHRIASDPAIRAEAAEAIGADYDGSTPVKHLLEVLSEEAMLDEIARRAARPLRGLRVASYYGCLLVRPPEVMQPDDSENPMLMDKLLAACGAEPLDWPHKVECCGASFSITKVESVRRLSREILAAARDAGADCLATACPLCQSNLDLRQREIEAQFGERFGLPVFYFTQLLGLALGLSPAEVSLRSLIEDPRPCLERAGVLPCAAGSKGAGR